MKRKISVTLNQKSLPKIREAMALNKHSNKSQAIESFLQRLLEDTKK